MAHPPPPASGEKKHWWLRNRKVGSLQNLPTFSSGFSLLEFPICDLIKWVALILAFLHWVLMRFWMIFSFCSQIVEKYIKDARALMVTREQSNIASAMNLLDAALSLSPRLEEALELKARSLLHLRRFRDVADMLQDYIPSLRIASENPSSSSSSSSPSSSPSFSCLSLSSYNNTSSLRLCIEGVKLLPSRNSFADDNSPAPASWDDSLKCFSVPDLKRKVKGSFWKSFQKDCHWR